MIDPAQDSQSDVPVFYTDRARAESFGAAADVYDRCRPGYPQALLDDAVDILSGENLSGEILSGEILSGDGLDVGCGTGIAGALVAARGLRLLGVEPDAAMAALARRRGLVVEEETFERWDPRGRRFDLVMSAQAWHWVHPFLGAAKAAELLRPGGRIALFWNHKLDPPELSTELDAVRWRLAPGVRDAPIRIDRVEGRRTSPLMRGLRAVGSLGEPTVRTYEWSRTQSHADWLAELTTHSAYAALDAHVRAELLDTLGRVLARSAEDIIVRYRSVLVTADRRSGGLRFA